MAQNNILTEVYYNNIPTGNTTIDNALKIARSLPPYSDYATAKEVLKSIPQSEEYFTLLASSEGEWWILILIREYN